MQQQTAAGSLKAPSAVFFHFASIGVCREAWSKLKAAVIEDTQCVVDVPSCIIGISGPEEELRAARRALRDRKTQELPTTVRQIEDAVSLFDAPGELSRGLRLIAAEFKNGISDGAQRTLTTEGPERLETAASTQSRR